jgi:hypothetical protein
MYDRPMNVDEEKADLALSSLGRHEGYRTWTGVDWEVMGRRSLPLIFGSRAAPLHRH